MRMVLGVVALTMMPTALSAADIGKLSRAQPDMQLQSEKSIYDIERCIVEVDGPGIPSIYRQPDRPNHTLIAYSMNSAVIFLVGLERNETGAKVELRRGSPGFGKVRVPESLTNCF